MRFYCCALLLAAGSSALPAQAEDLFRERVALVFERRCVRCHEGAKPKGGLSLSTRKSLLAGGESGPAVVPERPAESLLLDYITGDPPAMPKSGSPLTEAEVQSIRDWIAAGAAWPDGLELVDRRPINADWWSLRPLQQPEIPSDASSSAAAHPIDAFIGAELKRRRLTPSPPADRRTLIRRLYFDLLGLPPPPEEVDRFVADSDPAAYEKLVDRLLGLPAYGERWGRHWLDVVHYGDTHGFDKDKIRPHAWPYRDYVIRSFNEDKPYSRFVLEQIAGDVLFPATTDGIVATGFIAAGPFDFVGQIEVAEGTLDKSITRNLDRDDMVATTINTFNSMTVQCARCHNHKFDPITQEDYYGLQAVFAGVDRANRPYPLDAETLSRQRKTARRLEELNRRRRELEKRIDEVTQGSLTRLSDDAVQLALTVDAPDSPAFGYHSQIESKDDVLKWVQVDLGTRSSIARVVLIPAHDTFGGIGAGFGFPRRFKLEACDDPAFKTGVKVLDERLTEDFPNPKAEPYSVQADVQARYIRVTATRLAPRTGDYHFALAEVQVEATEGKNLAASAAVTALDSIEAPPRWGRANLVDGHFPQQLQDDIANLRESIFDQQKSLLEVLDRPLLREFEAVETEQRATAAALEAILQGGTVYAAATDFAPAGSFTPTKGIPRKVALLHRGSEKQPGADAAPGACAYIPELPAKFDLPPNAMEGDRRAALARWLADNRNPLTWRSIVNRVWQYHFGRGLVDSPNDFGRMGTNPSHPELLDWLAAEFRDGGRWIEKPQSIKRLHRLICTSAAYRQSSAGRAECEQADAGNIALWRMNRRKLEAETIRDAVLAAAGKLNGPAGGPGFYAFEFRDDHSPHYLYEVHDPDDPRTHRRSVYRFLVRSVPDPFMATLDCADSSLAVAKRSETLTPLQSLALWNNPFMVRMSEHFAARAVAAENTLPDQVGWAWRQALGRNPNESERKTLVEYASTHGLASACRVIFNTNEFVLVD